MKLFAQMLLCVIVGLSIGSSISWQQYRSELIEVRVVRVVKTREDSTMRFADNPVPHTVVEYRPPVMQFAIPGIAGDVGDVIYELPPKSR
jgi:hypothetical protein